MPDTATHTGTRTATYNKTHDVIRGWQMQIQEEEAVNREQV